MRAATVIVGAIAAASLLVAAAFILTPGGSSQTVTRTVTVEAKAPVATEPAGGESSQAHLGGPEPCGDGAYTVEGTSCAVGEQVHAGYEGGRRGELTATDPETGATLGFVCKDETEPITCTGAGGDVVYFGG